MTRTDALSIPLPENDQAIQWLWDVKTPGYVFDPSIALARYRRLRELLDTGLIVSLKANSNLELLIRCGHGFVDGVELASLGELDLAVGRIAATKYVNNPSMDETFMRAALASRCVFIIDSLGQAERLAGLMGKQPAPQTVLRLNAAELMPGRRREAADHFGMSPQEALLAAAALSRADIPVIGLHSFAGSHQFRVDDSGGDSADLAHALAAFAADAAGATGAPIEFLNCGGGFGERFHDDEAAFAAYRERLAPLRRRFRLVHESGRGIFAGAGLFATRVRAVKTLGGRTVAVCDGGLSHNFLLARTESAIKKYARPRLLHRQPAADGAAVAPVQYVGSTCSRADIIGWQPDAIAAPGVGDLVIFEQCGAYHPSYSVSGFLSLGAAGAYIHQSGASE
ncbi:hypothetical protein VA599_12040 [Chromobacterium sp. TRC.1.1.SA]|uniref:Orn/DAP/Arg decarboxylase 2 N-terminal domain-containing protein n=1 Tax=Chromobacterium indicum TaxID=3110228 RepID=A0ABV0CKE8_9NEIS